MKNNKKYKPSYSALQWKVFLQIIMIGFVTLIIIGLIGALTNQRLANWIVDLLQRVFYIDFDTAVHIYQVAIRDNIIYLIFATFIVIFIVLSRFILLRFKKYFNEISGGLDALVGDRNSEIRLSPEMAFMEKKLTAIKQTLEHREHEVKSSEQRKNELVMYLAHDIKTPMTSVIGYLSLLDEATDMPIEQKEKYIKIALEKAERLEGLVDEFFEISRYSSQVEALSKEYIDLYYMLIQMSDEFYPLLSSSEKEITLDVPEDLVIYGNSEKLARVFNNILKNAIAYSPEKSKVEIVATESEEMISIQFINKGNIPKEKLAAIFDKFYRLDSARSTGTGGTGLGLAIAKEIILSHGGKIYANNNQGRIIFTVELPRRERKPQSELPGILSETHVNTPLIGQRSNLSEDQINKLSKNPSRNLLEEMAKK